MQNKGSWNRQQSDHPPLRTIHTITGSMCLNHDFQEPGKQRMKVMLYFEYLCQQGYYILFYMSQWIPFQAQLVKYKATNILSSYSSDNKDSSFLGYDAMMTGQYWLAFWRNLLPQPSGFKKSGSQKYLSSNMTLNPTKDMNLHCHSSHSADIAKLVYIHTANEIQLKSQKL